VPEPLPRVADVQRRQSRHVKPEVSDLGYSAIS